MNIHVKDPGSALTHFIAMLGAAAAAAPLSHEGRSRTWPKRPSGGGSGGFSFVSMILLYGASTIYHTLDISEKVNRRLRKLDHMMIFILIAGTYTPVCLIVLGNRAGFLLLALVWGIAAVGILINALWISCPKWFSSLIYISMGWVCITAIREILNALPPAAFGWLLAGGIIYTIGGIIYALKLPIFNSRHKNFRLSRNFPSLCHGREPLPLCDDVRVRRLTQTDDRDFGEICDCLNSVTGKTGKAERPFCGFSAFPAIR